MMIISKEKDTFAKKGSPAISHLGVSHKVAFPLSSSKVSKWEQVLVDSVASEFAGMLTSIMSGVADPAVYGVAIKSIKNTATPKPLSVCAGSFLSSSIAVMFGASQAQQDCGGFVSALTHSGASKKVRCNECWVHCEDDKGGVSEPFRSCCRIVLHDYPKVIPLGFKEAVLLSGGIEARKQGSDKVFITFLADVRTVAFSGSTVAGVALINKLEDIILAILLFETGCADPGSGLWEKEFRMKRFIDEVHYDPNTAVIRSAIMHIGQGLDYFAARAEMNEWARLDESTLNEMKASALAILADLPLGPDDGVHELNKDEGNPDR